MPRGYFSTLPTAGHVDYHTHGHSPQLAFCHVAIFFFFFPPKKYHKNIKTTFEIYHEHKIKLHKSIINNVFVNYTNQHNNIYKSEDHVLINVFITNKTKLHRISTNLKTVSRITNSHTRRVFTNRRLLRLRWYSGRWCLNGGVLAQLSSNRRQRTNRCRITCK